MLAEESAMLDNHHRIYALAQWTVEKKGERLVHWTHQI
jgi:hypothetical protein